MTDYSELIERLRERAWPDGLYGEAVDAIEALTAEVDVLEDDVLRFLRMRNAARTEVERLRGYLVASLPMDMGDGTSIRRVRVALDYAPFGDTFYVEAADDIEGGV